MEKKKYIAPECEVIEVEIDSQLLAGSFTDSDFDDKEDEENDSGMMGANQHRGEWGNLWSDWGK